MLITVNFTHMKSTSSWITLYRDKDRRGSDIQWAKYESLRDFILSKLRHDEPLTVSQLLDLSFEQFGQEDRNSLSRIILAVKRDIEIRGLIKVRFDLHRNQYITLTKKNRLSPELSN